jgi:YidC/Oxa1 family membrane protein insertase
MDRNTIIGFALIFAIVLAWQQFTKPSAEQLQAEQRMQDSIRTAQQTADSLVRIRQMNDESTANLEVKDASTMDPSTSDSLQQLQLAGQFGPFSGAATGAEQTYVLQNEVLRLEFSNKGGRIIRAELKNFKKVSEDEKSNEIKTPLFLLEDDKNKFEYLIPVPSADKGMVRTSLLYFDAQQQGNSITFRANAGNGKYFEQVYTLPENTYNVDYGIRFNGLQDVIDPDANGIELNWVNYLDKLEKNVQYERNYSTVYFKKAGENVDHCSCTGDDTEEIDKDPIKWVSNANQFFNSSLIAEEAFTSAELETVVLGEENEDLKQLSSVLEIPYANDAAPFVMDFYIGPNEFERLQAYDVELEMVVPFGRSILGTVNRWVIRPIFSFISRFFENKGLVILILTLIVKLLMYPFAYRMLHSQTKMGLLKPHLAEMGEKFKDDPQKKQMETMKVYQEFGVNPLGGCLPVVLQMPIWIALYRFFPAAIEFRQESFLWASDLSSYDVAFSLPFDIPFYGDHVSLFTLLWAGTTVLYTYYNTKHMDMSGNPAMKYMQYFMPVMFLFFFNNFAAGLTCYLLFSNIMNITQTIVTKNYIINKDKLMADLEAYRKKPKKKGGFGSRLQNAMQESQRIQAEREKNKKGGKKKK